MYTVDNSTQIPKLGIPLEIFYNLFIITRQLAHITSIIHLGSCKMVDLTFPWLERSL